MKKRHTHALLSSSGDGTVKAWDYEKGGEIASRTVYEDAGMKKKDDNGNGDKDDPLRGETRDTPAVKAIRVHEGENETQIIAAIEG